MEKMSIWQEANDLLNQWQSPRPRSPGLGIYSAACECRRLDMLTLDGYSRCLDFLAECEEGTLPRSWYDHCRPVTLRTFWDGTECYTNMSVHGQLTTFVFQAARAINETCSTGPLPIPPSLAAFQRKILDVTDRFTAERDRTSMTEHDQDGPSSFAAQGDKRRPRRPPGLKQRPTAPPEPKHRSLRTLVRHCKAPLTVHCNCKPLFVCNRV